MNNKIINVSRFNNNLVATLDDGKIISFDINNKNEDIPQPLQKEILKFYFSDRNIPQVVTNILSKIEYWFSKKAVVEEALALDSVNLAYDMETKSSLSTKMLNNYNNNYSVRIATDNLVLALEKCLEQSIREEAKKNKKESDSCEL